MKGQWTKNNILYIYWKKIKIIYMCIYIFLKKKKGDSGQYDF